MLDRLGYGVRAGSAFVVRKSKTTAHLRILILSPEARGLSLGGKLCDECIAFAREKGYKKMTLWTNACLLRRELFMSNADLSSSRQSLTRALVLIYLVRSGS